MRAALQCIPYTMYSMCSDLGFQSAVYNEIDCLTD